MNDCPVGAFDNPVATATVSQPASQGLPLAPGAPCVHDARDYTRGRDYTPGNVSEAGRLGALSALTAGHAINDMYVAFVAPLLPFLVTRLNISLAVAGAVASILSVTSSLIQPVLGYFADRSQNPVLVMVGPIITSAAMCTVALAPNLPAVVALMIMAGIGTACFHPPAAALVDRISAGDRMLPMSIFITAGEVGYAIGPVFILLVIGMMGLQGTPLAVIPGVLVSMALYHMVIRGRNRNPMTAGSGKAAARGLPIRSFLSSSLFCLWSIAALRTGVMVSFITFLPTLLQQKGFSLMLGGTAASIFCLSGSVGILLGGVLADRFEKRVVMAISLLLPVAFLYAFLHTTGILSFACLVAGGMSLYASTSLTTGMAQKLVPGGVSTVSGLMMGLAWGTGALLLSPVGAAADAMGLEAALSLILLVLILATALVKGVPRGLSGAAGSRGVS
ncbi:MAG TPA: MFS transporter [Firmicutes bacterium]|nr:MFS transporter [Bacillota bacterium]